MEIRELVEEMVVSLGPVCIAFIIGLFVGWIWKPKWVRLKGDKLSVCVSNFLDSSLPSSPLKGFGYSFHSPSVSSPNSDSSLTRSSFDNKATEFEDCSLLRANEGQSHVASLVTEEDLKYLYQLVEVKDGGPSWTQMMDRSSPTMRYQAWKREPKGAPPQYRTRTIFEDATPEIVRDFFWDDEFRVWSKWDDMLASYNTIDECSTTGTMLVQWIRKFPFFCSDREYIIGRRIWDAGRSYYCVTKGVPCSSVPRRDKPRRVDLCYSSWCIRAVEPRREDGQRTACEVLLFHYEDMGIPWEIAKLGVRQGMWGMVKKIEPGLRAYQKERASVAKLSRAAYMAQINTKVNPDLLSSAVESLETKETSDTEVTATEKPSGRNIPKLLIIAGAIVVACSMDGGLLTKAFIFGIGRRFANMGKKR